MPVTIFGGTPKPGLDICISECKLPISVENAVRNIRNADMILAMAGGLGSEKFYQNIPVERAHPHRLAVVGGGTSIKDHIKTLKAWPGDIWAINGAWRWCKDNEIKATLFACDPDPIVLKWAEGADNALLGNACDPAVFDLVKDATIFDCNGEEGGLCGRGSTATFAPHLACRMGYMEGITFFGCESCYPPGRTHAYQHESRAEELLVVAGGVEYMTAPDFYVQAIELANFIRELPGFLKEESGGLLRALVKDPRFHVRWVSDELAKNIVLVRKEQPA